METLERSTKYIDIEIANGTERHVGRFEPILRVKTLWGKADLILELACDIIKDCNIARSETDKKKWNSMDGYTYRVFNGKYWEVCYSNDVMRSLFRSMRKHGIPMEAMVKLEHKLTKDVMVTVRGKILKPRLTLMCFKNGVVDFTENDLVLHKHNPKHDVIKEYPFDFDMKAPCPLWKDFLGEPYHFHSNIEGILPELQKRRQLQMFLGSMLLDRSKVKFEYFMILQGNGSNGKGVIFQAIQGVFGMEEVNTLELSMLARTGDEKLRAAAALDGKRILYCPEEDVIRKASGLTFLKSIVSGEPIAMRHLGEDIETVVSPPIVMFNTNHKFKTNDFFNKEDSNDISMLRRVKIINFEKSIPTERRDTRLAERLMAERAGIFAWIVKGYRELKRHGYRMPESVQGEIDLLLEKAKNDVDVDGKKVSGLVQLYLQRKRTYPKPNDFTFRVDVASQEIYNNFVDFCLKEGLEPVTQQKFGRDLSNLGYVKKKVQNIKTFVYTIHCDDEKIARDYILQVPSLVDEVKAHIFEDLGEEEDSDMVLVE